MQIIFLRPKLISLLILAIVVSACEAITTTHGRLIEPAELDRLELGVPTQAETIKQRYGCAVSSMTRPEEIMMVPGMGGRAERELSRQALADVLERRYVEIFSMAQQKLSLSGFDELIPAGIVLTGGASKIEGATELAEEIFHSPVRLGSPHSIEGFAEIINNPIYATSVGLLLYGQKQLEEDHLNYIHRDKNILNRISRWFGGNL